MSVVFDALHSCGVASYYGLVDLLNVASRPLVLASYTVSGAETFAGHGLFSGFIVTVSLALVVAGVSAVLLACRCSKPCFRLWMIQMLLLPFALDALWQLPGLLLLTNSSYPLSHTGIGTVPVLMASAFFYPPVKDKAAIETSWRVGGVAFSMSLRYTCATLVTSPTLATVGYVFAWVGLVGALLANTRAGKYFSKIVEAVMGVLSPIIQAFAGHVRAILVYREKRQIARFSGHDARGRPLLQLQSDVAPLACFVLLDVACCDKGVASCAQYRRFYVQRFAVDFYAHFSTSGACANLASDLTLIFAGSSHCTGRQLANIETCQCWK